MNNNLFATLINRFKNALIQCKGVWFTTQSTTPQGANGRVVIWADGSDSDKVKVTRGSGVTTRAVESTSTVLASLTGSLTGTADGALVDVAATAGACAGGSSPSATNVDAAIATAVASIVTGVNTQNKELLTKLNEVITLLRTQGIGAAS